MPRGKSLREFERGQGRGKREVHVTHYLEECFGRECVRECEERHFVRMVDFFPQIERDAVRVLVSTHSPDLLFFFPDGGW
jgi:hypothetical protein